MKGDTDMNRVYAPQRVYSDSINNEMVTAIYSGENFSGFLTASGELFTFGDNSDGQLGIGINQSNLFEPRRVVCDEKIVQASLGNQHMLLLTQLGRVLGAGRNREYQLGLKAYDGQPEHGSWVPVRIDSIRDVDVIKVVAGGFSAALIQNSYERQLLVWGQGDFGTFE